jgi:hypothetical protein
MNRELVIAITHRIFPDVYFLIITVATFLHVFMRRRFWSGVLILWGLGTAYYFVMALVVPTIVMQFDKDFAFMFPEEPALFAFAVAGWMGCAVFCLIPFVLRLVVERIAPNKFKKKTNTEAQQSAAPLPPPPKTGSSEGAR